MTLCPHNYLPVHHKTGVCSYDKSVCYEYVELIAKNNQYRFKDINMKNKCSDVI